MIKLSINLLGEKPKPKVRSWMKLDGVGPVDNKPSTDKLHHFVKKKKKCDM